MKMLLETSIVEYGVAVSGCVPQIVTKQPSTDISPGRVSKFSGLIGCRRRCPKPSDPSRCAGHHRDGAGASAPVRKPCSERLVCEPAAFYVRSRATIADDPSLPFLPDEPRRSRHTLDCPKDGLDYLRWWYSAMNLSRSSLCVRVMSPQAWLPPFLQAVLDLGSIRGVQPRLAISSHSSLAR